MITCGNLLLQAAFYAEFMVSLTMTCGNLCDNLNCNLSYFINYAGAINCGLLNTQKVAFVASGAQQGFRKN